MRIILAYISIIIIWATTPLAIKWSGEESGFIFAVVSRMTIGTLCMVFVLLIRGRKLPSHRKARLTYFSVAIQIYGAMMCVYWGAQFIPSGWVSVIFGLSPFITAIFAAIWLKERSLTIGKLLSYLLGISGLAIMFSSALTLNNTAVYGITAVLTAVSLQTASAVWVKRINAKLPAMTQVTGGLLFAFPAYIGTWLLIDNGFWPQTISILNIACIVYLGLIATTIGFVLYYYVLIHLSATQVGMIPLMAPVIALYLGNVLNHEPLSFKIVLGTAFILSALLVHNFFDRLFKAVKIRLLNLI